MCLLFAGRVDGLGGNSQGIPPSLGGYPGKRTHPEPEPFPGLGLGHRGKVAAIFYDRFGDFEGFVLRTESGKKLRFHGHKPRVEQLVRLAWEERWLITVKVQRDEPHWPSAIILHRAARDLRH